jgi:hypothetical protein
MRHDKDRSGKWLLGHHGDSILRLSGITGFTACRAAQAEIVAPRRLPNGLLDVVFPGDLGLTPFLVEIVAYSDSRADDQVLDDVLLVALDRQVVPEVISLVLHPRGNVQVQGQRQRDSRRGLTRLHAHWRVVQLWTVEAEPLLAAGDVGMVPWVPLAKFDGPPEMLLRRCRDQIDRRAKPEEHDSLLSVTQLLGGLRFTRELLRTIFGGGRPMIESPLLDELVNEAKAQALQDAILDVLKDRLGAVPEGLVSALRAVQDQARLRQLNRWAGQCPDFAAFQARLAGGA